MLTKRRLVNFKAFFALVTFLGLIIPFFSVQAQSEKSVQEMEKKEFGLSYENTAPEPLKKENSSGNIPKEDPAPEDYQVQSAPEKVKPIEAEEFKINLLKKSSSGKILLFNDLSENRPKPGKVLLLKNGQNDIAAVRVLKNYQKQNQSQFAAKIILSFNPPQVGSEYRALKKLGDKMVQMIKEREKRGKDLTDTLSDEELAKEVSPDDNELDRGIPLPNKPKKNTAPKVEKLNPDSTKEEKDKSAPLFNKDGSELSSENVEVNEDDDQYEQLSVTEEKTRLGYTHILSVEYASLISYDKLGQNTSYKGFGLRYGYNIVKNPFLKKRSIEDLLTIELALFYYQISGFSENIDIITVYPLVGTLRYSVVISDTFSFFTYLGLVKNNVSLKDGGITSATDNLTKTKVALGLGTLIDIGPGWAIRLEYGLDMFAIGASLKF